MKNAECWQPSKFIVTNGMLRASNNAKEISISSRLIANAVADFYGEIIPKYARGQLLDLGCGKVPLYSLYKPFIDDNICVDWANSMHENKYLDMIADLNQKLPLDSDSFDTIILSDVLEHIRKPDLLWSEMSRILKVKGYIIMNVPFFYWLHEEPHDYFRYTKFALKSMAEEHGFEVKEIRHMGGVFEILVDIISKILIKLPILGKFVVILIQRFAWFFTKTRIGIKISRISANKFPLGYGMIAMKIR